MPEERDYGTVPGLAQATQAAVSYTRAQINPTMERGPPRENRPQNLQQDNTATKAQKEKTDKKSKEVLLLPFLQTLADIKRQFISLKYGCCIMEKGGRHGSTASSSHNGLLTIRNITSKSTLS